MAIRFECVHCRSSYEVADAMAGKPILCRDCEQRGRVAAACPASAPQDRRNFLGLALAGGAIGVAAFVAGYYWPHPLSSERLGRTSSNPAEPGDGAQGGPGAPPAGRPRGRGPGQGGGRRGRMGPMQ
jgi:hypothetical protein